MKNIYITMALLIIAGHLTAQVLGPVGLSSGCTSATTGGYVLSYVVGDMTAVQTVKLNNTVLTQGLLQPNDHNLGTIINGTVTPTSSTICKGSSQLFTLTGYHGQKIQWQYNNTQSGNSLSWTNFGTNNDTATLSIINKKVYVRAIVSSFAQAPASSTDAVVMLDSTSILTLGKLTNNTAIISWQPILGASTYTVHYNGSTHSTSGLADTLTGLLDCTTYSVYVTPDLSVCGSNGTDTIKFITLPSALILKLSAGSGNTVNANWSGNAHYKYKLYVSNTVSLPNFTVYNVKDTSYAIPVNAALSRTLIAYVVLDSGSICSIKPISKYAYYNVAGSSCTNNAPVITSKSFFGKRLSVTWTGTASGYQFYFKKLTDYTWTSHYTITNNITVDVRPNACYLVMVVNRCSKTPLVFGYTSNIDTVCSSNPCSAPANLILSYITCKGFNATWNTVNGATEYGMYFAEYRNGVLYGVNNNYRVRSNSIRFRNLGRNKTYQIFVTALNCSGNNTESGPSNIETITTLNTGCKTDNDESDTLTLQNSLSNVASLSLYPNPNNGTFTLSYSHPGNKGTIYMEIFNLIGQVIYTEQIDVESDTFIKAFQITGQAAGTYFVHISQGNTHNISRMVLTK